MRTFSRPVLRLLRTFHHSFRKTSIQNSGTIHILHGNIDTEYLKAKPLRLSRPLKLMWLYSVKLISTETTGDPRVSKRPDFRGLFRFPKKLNFLISVFLYFWGIFGYISGTKRATGDPQVSKRPDFLGLFRFPKKELIFGFLYFCISVFLYFFWISGHISGTKRATGDLRVSKGLDF